MSVPFSVCISFSGLTFRFSFPHPLALPAEFLDLRCEDSRQPDEAFEIRLLSEPLRPDSPATYLRPNLNIYNTKEGWLYIYPPLIAEDGCQVACLLCPDHKNILFYPASRWDFYSSPLHCLHLIAGEVLLLRYNAFLLHSSVVMLDGKAVLFSGPSGAGKSTQASLWAHHLGAQILNGDRCVVMRKEGSFYGGGSPWCGTSGIHRKEQAPIAGIFLVHQAPENSVRQLKREAFVPLLTQTTVNSWDAAFMQQVTQLLADLITEVPIYHLDCRPDRDAVALCYETLFRKEFPL